MNILFNKKILFSLLLSSSLLIQGAYAQDDGPSSNVYGTLDIPTGSSLDTPELQVDSSGSVTVGNNSLSDGTGVLCIKDDTNDNTTDVDPHSTVSNIQKNLTINIDGNFLNEETMNCNGSDDNRAKVTNNKGLFINQGYINVGQYATLTCGIFPTSSDAWKYTDPDSGTEETVPYYANYVGIMNGSCPFNATKTPTFMYSYDSTNNTASVNIDNKDDSNKYPTDKFGTITFFPGASCNDGNPQGNPAVEGQGKIDGGIIDLTKYVKIQTNNSTTSNDTSVSTNDLYSLQFENGANNNKDNNGTPTSDNNTTILKINIKNAKIQLFTDNKITNSNNYTVNKEELSQLKLEVFSGNNTSMKDMFANLTFENCICEIPRDEGSGTVAYNFSNGTTSKTYEQANTKENGGLNEKIITFNADAADRYKVGSSGSGGSSNNFNMVKQLFKSDGDPSYRIYHGIGEIGDDGYFSAGYTNYDCDTTISKDTYKSNTTTPNKGLVLYGSGDGDSAGGKDTFSKLFNSYMGLNCYIDLSKVDNVVSDDITSKKLDLVLRTPISHNTNDKYTYDIFIQLANNVTGFTNSDIVINKQTSNFADTNPTTADFDGTLELVMKNPWIHTNLGAESDTTKTITYKGTLSRDLPTLTETVTTAPSDDTGAAQYVTLLEKYIPHEDSDISGYSSLNNLNKLNALVKKGLDMSTDPETSNIIDCINRYNYLNSGKNTTKIVQKYDGPAFNKYSVTISDTDTTQHGNNSIDTTNKSICPTSEILEYAVETTCSTFSADKNFGNTKPFTVDKFTIGDGTNLIGVDNVEDDISQSTTLWTNLKKSDILTQNFTVNDKATYKLKGHITVRNLKAGDFKKA